MLLLLPNRHVLYIYDNRHPSQVGRSYEEDLEAGVAVTTSTLNLSFLLCDCSVGLPSPWWY